MLRISSSRYCTYIGSALADRRVGNYVYACGDEVYRLVCCLGKIETQIRQRNRQPILQVVDCALSPAHNWAYTVPNKDGRGTL